MSIEVNGVTLPDIPSEYIEKYPYIAICSYYDAQATGQPTYIFLNMGALEFVLVPKSFTGGEWGYIFPGMGSVTSGCQYKYNAETDAWDFSGENTESFGFDIADETSYGSSSVIIGSNHDIYAVESIDMETETVIFSSEPYFAANFSVSDPNYYAPKSWYDGMARQVMRLTGTSDKLTTDEMLARLKSYEGGGSGAG